MLNALLSVFRSSRKEYWEIEHITKSIKREIEFNLDNLEDFVESIEGIRPNFEKEELYKPWLATNHKSGIVFESNREVVLKLKSDLVEKLIGYYAYDAEINQMMDKLQTQDFAQLSAERKNKVLDMFIVVVNDAEQSGMLALSELDSFAKKQGNSFIMHKIRSFFDSVKRTYQAWAKPSQGRLEHLTQAFLRVDQREE